MLFQKSLKAFLASELGRIAPYFDELILEHQENTGKRRLFDLLGAKHHQVSVTPAKNAAENKGHTQLFIIDGDLNHSNNVQEQLSQIYKQSNRSCRVAAILYNPYLRWLYKLTNKLGLSKSHETQNFVTQTSLVNFAKITGFDVVNLSNVYFFPFRLRGLGDWINRLFKIIPIVNKLAIASIAYLRPIKPETEEKSISIIIAARNESGNIANILDSIPAFTEDIELIFVEGNSTDDTWEKINTLIAEPKYQEKYAMMALKQPGKGKADAVRVGFRNATKDLVTILDADLTMPDEDLPKYYNAYLQGLADFINGSRLVYPMEKDAMRFINHVGNIFFAKLLSTILDIQISDSLCGTKFFSRADYQRIRQWNDDFGDFDPFGDYEMIFPASVLKLGIVDIPIIYKARTYGETNISRFKDSIKLFRMCLIGFFRIKL